MEVRMIHGEQLSWIPYFLLFLSLEGSGSKAKKAFNSSSELGPLSYPFS